MENDLLRWFRESLPQHSQVLLGPGDDAAILRLAAGANLVATTDMLMAGVDFHLGQHAPERIGRKALAVNLSDLAAMAARPVAALVSLCLPRQGGEALAKALYAGLLPLAAEFDCAIAGGDVNSWDGPLVINVAALGEVQPGREWRRSGARPGDVILVTGSFGGSILAKHFDFTPRVREALWLAERYEIHAAIDVSDGLSLDLARLCDASGCGAVIDPQRIPIASAAIDLATREPDRGAPLDRALSDGEDFELILAVSSETATKLLAEQPLATPLTQIGSFVAEPGLRLRDSDGVLQPLTPRGWEHELES
jgi:thiamine-monophosphate kinase